jgi:hypothetical protein
LVRAIRGRNQPIDRLADQGFQLRIVIGTAIGGQNPFVLALGGRGLRDRPGRFERVCRRNGGLKPGGIAAGSQRKGDAQQNGRSQKAANHPRPVPFRTLYHFSYSYLSRGLIFAKQLNLPRPEHFDSRPAARLDPAANTNPSILERLNEDTRSLEARCHPP